MRLDYTGGVEGLTGKHAIYLVAEGPDIKHPENDRRPGGPRREPQRPQGLFDLHGIGFSALSAPFQVPVVPQITITADGKRLHIPDTPIRSTNQNGYTDAIRYQVYGPLTSATRLQATASHPDVKIQVGTITDGRAIIRATYQGREKIYLVN